MGLLTLLAAVAAAATGTWWLEAHEDAIAVSREEAVLDVVSADLASADVLISQAIVHALAGEASLVEAQSITGVRMAAEDALSRLDARSVSDETVNEMVDQYVAQGDRIVGLLAVGDLDEARTALASDLSDDRAAFERAVAGRADVLQWSASTAREAGTLAAILSSASTVLLVVGLLALVWHAWRRGDGSDDVDEMGTNGTHVVIQLPSGPNPLPERRRYPKVEDLGWLIGQVVEPFRARGWDMGIDCPHVGVDCDPADVREILTSIIGRAEDGGAERIGVIVQTSDDRVKVVVADDGEPLFRPGGYLSGSEPIKLRSAVRTRTEAATAELRWSRSRDLNLATLELPRLKRSAERLAGAGV